MSVQCISRFLLKVEYKPRNMSHNIEIVLSYFLYTSQRARIISLSPLYSSSAFWVICSVIQCYPGGCQSEKKKKTFLQLQQPTIFRSYYFFIFIQQLDLSMTVFNQNLCLLSSLISLLSSFPLCTCLLSYAMCLPATPLSPLSWSSNQCRPLYLHTPLFTCIKMLKVRMCIQETCNFKKNFLIHLI